MRRTAARFAARGLVSVAARSNGNMRVAQRAAVMPVAMRSLGPALSVGLMPLVAHRSCAGSAQRDPKSVGKLIESAAAPLYQAVAQAKSGDEIAEACLQMATERANREGELNADLKLEDAGVKLVAAESLTQIGLLDDAKKDITPAYEVFVEQLGANAYYTARALCLRSRLHALVGDRQAALDDLNLVDAEAAMDDAPTDADKYLLRTFIHNGRGTLVQGMETIKCFSTALNCVNDAINSAQVALEEAKAKNEPVAVSTAEQSLFVALTMRTTLLVDTSGGLLRLQDWDDALKALDEAEKAARSLPSFVEGQDHPALADIDYHRAVAMAGKGEQIDAAAKAAVAYRILAATMPIAVDKLADIKELEVACLGNVGNGELGLKELDALLDHLARIEKEAEGQVDPRVVAHCMRKAHLAKLNILDNRGEYNAILELFDKGGLSKALEDASPEGRLFAASRHAQAYALSGDIERATALMNTVREQAPEIVPSRVPDIELSTAYILYGSGKKDEGLALRKKGLTALKEAGIEGREADEEGEWYVSAATVAASQQNRALVDECLEAARTHMERKEFCFLAAPLLHSVGHYAEAASKAREALAEADSKVLAGELDGYETQREFGEAVAVDALEKLREQLKGEEHDQAVAKVRRVVEFLRRDARHRAADQYEKDLKAVAHA